MNEFGLSLLWLAFQVTVLCVVAVPVYLLVRRGDPRSGVLATLTTLLLIAGLSIASLSPWPHWSTASPEAVPVGVTATVETSIPAATASEDAIWQDEAPSRSGWVDAMLAGASAWRKIADGATPARDVDADRVAGLTWTGWVGWLFVCGMSVAVARVVVGLLQVARHKRHSVVVVDARVRTVLDELSRELRPGRPIDVWQTSAIASAATIGWWRPVILLPVESVEWSDVELRGVLAHEVAHIAGNDFLCWVCAQAGPVLHFYHPLVLWLASRLRLEQELAADAVAAECSGGRVAYLRTLAELALRQADRPVAWPARTFLPIRGTLMRRVDMLKNTVSDRRDRSTWKPPAVLAGMLAVAVTLSGIRAPRSDDLLADEPASNSAEPVQLAQGDGSSSRSPKVAADAVALDLSVIPSNATLVATVKVAALQAEPSVASLIPLADAQLKKIELTVADLDQVMLAGIPEENDPVGRKPFILIRLKEARAESLFAALRPRRSGSREETIDGVRVMFEQPDEAFALLDDRTVVMARGEVVRQYLTDRKTAAADPVWKAALNQHARQHFALMVDVRRIRPLLERQFNAANGPVPAGIIAFRPLWNDVEYFTAGASLGAEGAITANAVTLTNDAAERVRDTALANITLGRNMVAGLLAQLEKQPAQPTPPLGAMRPSELIPPVLRTAQQVLAGAKVTGTGTTVSITAPLAAETVNLPMLISLLAPAFQQAESAATDQIGRNKLKQLGLAFHNYHSSLNQWPSIKTLTANGKYPHSWRVAILPYVEQTDLYGQYRFDEPWDSPANLDVLKKMPAVYRHPSAPEDSTTTSYVVLTGPNTVTGDGSRPLTIRDCTDGTSNSILIVESKTEIPWTKPEDIGIDNDGPLPKLGGLTPNGFHVCLADGSVKLLSDEIDLELLRRLIIRNDGQAIDFQKLQQPVPANVPRR